MPADPDTRQVIRWLRAEMARVAGRQYRIDLEALDLPSLRELQRLLRDLSDEQRRAVHRARIFPWKAP